MTQKIQNKPYVMAILSKVAYLQPEKAEITFKEYGFHNYKFIENDGAQCYIVEIFFLRYLVLDMRPQIVRP